MKEQPKNKSPDLLEQAGAGTNVHDATHGEIITRTKGTVKRANWLKDFHTQRGLSCVEIVEAIRPLHPGFDRSLLSKCENTEKYGAQISQKAMLLLKKRYGGEKETMDDLPDAPWIRDAETNGVPDEPLPNCPICGEETEKFFLDRDGDIIGCEYCIRAVDSENYKNSI